MLATWGKWINTTVGLGTTVLTARYEQLSAEGAKTIEAFAANIAERYDTPTT